MVAAQYTTRLRRGRSATKPTTARYLQTLASRITDLLVQREQGGFFLKSFVAQLRQEGEDVAQVSTQNDAM